MTDLETELLNRLIGVSVKLAQKEEFITNSEYIYSDQDENVTELNTFLKQAVAMLFKVKGELRYSHPYEASEIDQFLAKLKTAGLPLLRDDK